MKALPLLPTAVVGSYPQPDWLVNRDVLAGRLRHPAAPGGMRRAPGFHQAAQPGLDLAVLRELSGG